MVAALNGIVFDQFYGDNSGGTEFDTDGDGTPTQEDEFVSVKNITGSAVDISGWQIWSDMTGAGAADPPQDGLYHTFPPGTVLQPGEVLYILNEITGTPENWMQEASEGGLESGSGGTNTNFLSEGASGPNPEGIALVNPVSGDYIILNFDSNDPTNIPFQSGFPGTTLIEETNVANQSGVEDQNAGSSFQYDPGTDSYVYGSVFVPCFAAGTRIKVPAGVRLVEELKPGELVETLDHGPQKLQGIVRRRLNFDNLGAFCHKPIEIKPNALKPGVPHARLIVSPQHRILIAEDDGGDVLVPAKALLGRPGVRLMKGRKSVTYVHLVFCRHEIVHSEGCWSESFYPGKFATTRFTPKQRMRLNRICKELASEEGLRPARKFHSEI